MSGLPTPELWTPGQQTDWDNYVAQARDAARMLMQSHVDSPHSGMHFLPPGESHEGQDPTQVLVAGNPLPRDQVEVVGRTVWPSFTELGKMAAADPQADSVAEQARDILQEGGNIWVNTLHFGDIKDIILALKLNLDLVHAKGHTPEHVMAVISHGIAEVEFEFETPNGTIRYNAVPTLGVLCDAIIKTWPRTASSKAVLEENLPAFGLRWSNHLSKSAIKRLFGVEDEDAYYQEDWPSGGGTMAAVAATGSTSATVGPDGKRYINSIGEGTAEMMMLPDTYVLPYLSWPHGDNQVAQFYSGPVRITEASQLDAMTQGMVEATNELVPGLNLAYEPPEHRQ